MAISVVVAYLLVTTVQLIGGEIVPKFYAIDRAESVARRVARPLQAFSVLFAPLIAGVTAISDRACCACSESTSSSQHDGGSPDELKRLIAESHAGGTSTPARPACSPVSFTCTSRRPVR